MVMASDRRIDLKLNHQDESHFDRPIDTLPWWCGTEVLSLISLVFFLLVSQGIGLSAFGRQLTDA